MASGQRAAVMMPRRASKTMTSKAFANSIGQVRGLQISGRTSREFMERYVINVPKIADFEDCDKAQSFVDEIRAENSAATFRVSSNGKDPVESSDTKIIGQVLREWFGRESEEAERQHERQQEARNAGTREATEGQQTQTVNLDLGQENQEATNTANSESTSRTPEEPQNETQTSSTDSKPEMDKEKTQTESQEPKITVTVEEVVKPVQQYRVSISLEVGRRGPVLCGQRIKREDEDPEVQPPRVQDTIDIVYGPSEAQLSSIVSRMGFQTNNQASAQSQLENLYAMFIGSDAVRLETSSLAEVEARAAIDASRGRQEVTCSEVTLVLDDYALDRQRELASKAYDPDDVHLGNQQAREAGLGFIPLQGPVGCIVNGAGLAMATMDMLANAGISSGPIVNVGSPNVDPEEAVATAIRILRNDPQVKVLLLNIFGGSTPCDAVARGIIEADNECYFDLPVVVRIVGTNVEESDRLLEESPVLELPADDLEHAVERVAEELIRLSSTPAASHQ